MKKLILFTFIIFSLKCFAQKDSLSKSNSKNIEWGSYYYINNEFKKAINAYESVNQKLPSIATKNLSKAYFKSGNKHLALKNIKKIIDGPKVDVEDYYFISQLLDLDPKLADEYIEKASRLPISHSELDQTKSSSDPLLNYKFHNVSINTPGTEFGGYLVPLFDEQGHITDQTMVFYLAKQIDNWTKKIKNKVISENEIYNIFRGKLDMSSLDILEGKVIETKINSIFQEGPISVHPGLIELYLSRSSGVIDENNKVQVDLYRADYDEELKGFPIPLDINMKGYSTMHPSLNIEEQRLYFSSDRPGGYGGMDLYYIPLSEVNDSLEIVNLGPDINTEFNEVFPYTSQKGVLFYSNDFKDDENGLDVFMAVNKFANRWSVSKLQSPFNSDGDDFSFGILKNNIGILSSNRSGGVGSDDLYTFEYKSELLTVKDNYDFAPSDTLIVSTNGVLNNDEKKMLSSDPISQLFHKKVTLIDSTKRGYLLLNKNGSFLYKSFLNESVKDSFSYRLSDSFGDSQKEWAIISPILDKKTEYIFRPIFYNLNKFNIIDKYKDRLDEIVNAMNRDSKIKVNVISSTDCRGSQSYNTILSISRTESILKYIKQKISDPNRITGIGIGEIQKDENKTLSYQVVVGSFKNINNVKRLKVEFLKSGIKAEIKETSKKLFRLVISDLETLNEANQYVLKLNKQNIKSWILKDCDCYKLDEQDHALNRKSIFEVTLN
jgi:outer membrane protein OmpA-like peptidoglycan-associated protein